MTPALAWRCVAERRRAVTAAAESLRAAPSYDGAVYLQQTRQQLGIAADALRDCVIKGGKTP